MADTCRWCHGTGWATLIDPVLGDAYDVPCPGDCPVPQPDGKDAA